jgi:hypothetical protein
MCWYKDKEPTMKHVSQLCLIIAALAAAPAALAGAQIVKCIDPSGHVTLTDQPCTDGAATVRMESEADFQAAPQQPAVEHFPASRALPRQGARSMPAPPKRMSLAHDVATMKAARVQLLLLDETAHAQHPRLAGLN